MPIRFTTVRSSPPSRTGTTSGTRTPVHARTPATTPSTHGDPLDVVDLLARVDHLVARRFARALAEGGSNIDEWRVLSLLVRAGGQSMSALAEATMLPPPTLTKRVDRMVASNLVYRRVDDADRRRVLVLPARRGLALHRRLAELVAEEQARLAAAAADAGVATADLAALLAALLPALDERRS